VQTVDPELVARVRVSAERLGYRANRVARALRRQSTQTVGLVIPDITDPAFPAVVKGIERELRASGLTLLFCDADNDVAVETELVHNLFDHQIDGLLISPCDPVASRATLDLAASRVPVLQVGRKPAPGLPHIGVDQADAMRKLIDHLVAEGSSSFAYIGPGPESGPRPVDPASQARLDEFLARAGRLDRAAADRICLGDGSFAWGHEAAASLLDHGLLPDAIVCGTDAEAAGVVQALREHGVKVPGEVLVTGFGDTDVAAACEPRLTSVRQPLEQLGAEAVALLRSAIGPSLQQPGSATLTAELVVRASSHRGAVTG
jgi:LacI family transcriptional regulator, galactose operon repressor